MTEGGHRCGFVALVGRPNVGKSTLLNALLGHPLSIVTPKPQTTRHRILGICTRPGVQLLYLDTPGLHRDAKRAINRYMNRAAARSLVEADVILFLVEALNWTRQDERILEQARNAPGRLVLVVNKVDTVTPKERLLRFLEEHGRRPELEAVVPVSAETMDNLEALEQVVTGLLPVSPPLYPADQVTDKSERFIAAEVVREKLTLALSQELPYGLTVEIEGYEIDEEGLLRIGAVIWVERQGQKAIVIGKGGEKLKSIGRAARLALKGRLGRPVHLSLWVKVNANWSDTERALRAFGYGEP